MFCLIQFCCQKILLPVYFWNWISTPVASGQYQISTCTHICIRPVGIASLGAAFVELIQIWFIVRYQTRYQNVLLRFCVQIWIRLITVLIRHIIFSVLAVNSHILQSCMLLLKPPILMCSWYSNELLRWPEEGQSLLTFALQWCSAWLWTLRWFYRCFTLHWWLVKTVTRIFLSVTVLTSFPDCGIDNMATDDNQMKWQQKTYIIVCSLNENFSKSRSLSTI